MNDEVRRLRAEKLRELEQQQDEQRRSLEDLLAAAVIGKDSMVVKRGATNDVRIAIKSRRGTAEYEEESTITDIQRRTIDNSDSSDE